MRKWMIALDIAGCVGFSCYMSIRMFYPKSYPPLDRYIWIPFACVLVAAIAEKKHCFYKNWETNNRVFFLLCIRHGLTALPLLIGLGRLLTSS